MSVLEDMKTIIAISRRYDDNMPVQLNAIGHVAQALGHEGPELRAACYRTADGQILGNFSWWPVIILSGRAAKVAELWAKVQSRHWPKACFVESMISGGSEVQLEATAKLSGPDLPIIALGIHGPAVDLNHLTRKLSLWKATNGS